MKSLLQLNYVLYSEMGPHPPWKQIKSVLKKEMIWSPVLVDDSLSLCAHPGEQMWTQYRIVQGRLTPEEGRNRLLGSQQGLWSSFC